MDAPPTKRGEPVVRKLGIVAAVLSLTLIAACGDDEKDRDLNLDKSASSSPSETTSTAVGSAANLPEEVTEPTAPPQLKNDLASAKEFTGYVLQLMHYDFATRDISSLRALVVDWQMCKFCKDDAASIKKLEREGEAQIPNRLPKAGRILVMDRKPDRFSLVATFQMPAGKRMSDAGKVLDNLKSVPGTLDVDLVWSPENETWLIRDYQLAYRG